MGVLAGRLYQSRSATNGRAVGPAWPFVAQPVASVVFLAVPEVVVMKFGGTSVANAERLKRAAERIVAQRENGKRFHLLRASEEEALALADAIREVKKRIGLCEACFNLADGPRCRICSDERRESDVICVVEEPSDVISIERTHEFRGRYHVLGGALSPIDGVDPEDLKIAELYDRVESNPEHPVREVVIATNPTTTREATALHIAAGLRERRPEISVTRLASGLPVGADLEYADELTLGRALLGRRAV